MNKTPTGNSACVLIQDPYTGLILGVSRKDDPNDFGLPGGKCEPGEDSLTTALRELREETGVLLKQAPCPVLFLHLRRRKRRKGLSHQGVPHLCCRRAHQDPDY